jgi:hypothetical protein
LGAPAPKTGLSAAIPQPLRGLRDFRCNPLAPHGLIADLNLVTVRIDPKRFLSYIKVDMQKTLFPLFFFVVSVVRVRGKILPAFIYMRWP